VSNLTCLTFVMAIVLTMNCAHGNVLKIFKEYRGVQEDIKDYGGCQTFSMDINGVLGVLHSSNVPHLLLRTLLKVGSWVTTAVTVSAGSSVGALFRNTELRDQGLECRTDMF
jgi:hypothetical protein